MPWALMSLLIGALVAPSPAAAMTAGVPASAEAAATAKGRSAKPLCRPGRVPIKRAGGFRCMKVRTPRADTLGESLAALAAGRPAAQRPPAEITASLRKLDELLAVDSSAGFTRLGLGSAARVAAAGGWTDTSGFGTDTWEPSLDGTTWRRSSGYTRTPPPGRIGIEWFVDVEIRTLDKTDAWTASLKVDLARCPDARGRVTGTVAARWQHYWEWEEPSGVLGVAADAIEVDAAVTAPVDDYAQIRPFDVKGTVRGVPFDDNFLSQVGSNERQRIPMPAGWRARPQERMGFVDVRVPLRNPGARRWTIPWTSPTFYVQAALMLDQAYEEVGDRLRALQAAWREEEQCVKVLPAPAMIRDLGKGEQRTIRVRVRRKTGGDVDAMVNARAEGGSIDPASERARPGSPAKLRFRMGKGSAAKVLLRSASRFGIGEAVVYATGRAGPPPVFTGRLTYERVMRNVWGSGSPEDYDVTEAVASATAQVTFRLREAMTNGKGVYDRDISGSIDWAERGTLTEVDPFNPNECRWDVSVTLPVAVSRKAGVLNSYLTYYAAGPSRGAYDLEVQVGAPAGGMPKYPWNCTRGGTLMQELAPIGGWHLEGVETAPGVLSGAKTDRSAERNCPSPPIEYGGCTSTVVTKTWNLRAGAGR